VENDPDLTLPLQDYLSKIHPLTQAEGQAAS